MAGGGTSRTVSTQELAPEQRQLLGLVMPQVTDYANTPLQMYPDSTIAGFDPLQTAARQNLLDVGNNVVSPLASTAAGTAGNLASTGSSAGLAGAQGLQATGAMGAAGLGGVLGEYANNSGARNFLTSGALLDPSTNPVLAAQSEAAVRPVFQGLTQQALPAIAAQSVGNNMFGSSRQGIAEGLAMQEALKQASDITTNLQANNFNQGLGAMLSSLNTGQQVAGSGIGQALGAGEAGTSSLLNAAGQGLQLSPSLAQLAYLPGLTAEGIGQSQQQMSQAQLSEAANRFMTEQMLPFLQAQDIANLAFGIGGGTGTSTASSAGDPLQTGLGMLSMLPMLMMML